MRGSQRLTPPTQVDRLIQAYPELKSGRFAVVADFEDPKHMELVQLIRVSDQARCVLNHERGRAETGLTCLEFGTGSPDDAIVINNEAAAHWYLKRDWRPYDLLIMSIQSPKRSLAAEITVAAGPPQTRLAAHASIPLERGWNVIRLDLAEIGERIPLDDIQEIRFSVTGFSKPVDLCLDDILLTGNREDLFGDSTNREAGLYVQRVGRRWKIGAGRPGADFELTFANGQIVEWYNLAADPYRLRNLVRGAALGPSPVVVGPSGAHDHDFTRFGGAVAVSSKIVEMNAVRAVVVAEWRFVEDPESAKGALDHRPFQRWVYTIYPTGQMYVAVTATSAVKSWSPHLGLAVTLSTTPEDDLQTFVPTQAEESEGGRPPIYGTVRSKGSDALLLYVLDDSDKKVRITESTADTDSASTVADHISLVAVAEGAAKDVQAWSCHILLGTDGEVAYEEALARAVDYANPAALRMELGSIMPVGGEHGDKDGFDPATGCYMIAPDQGDVRFVIDGRQQPRISPVFQIIGTEDRKAWVYVDHLIFDQIGHDAQGNLIFQLPEVIRKPTMVEVIPAPAG